MCDDVELNWNAPVVVGEVFAGHRFGAYAQLGFAGSVSNIEADGSEFDLENEETIYLSGGFAGVVPVVPRIDATFRGGLYFLSLIADIEGTNQLLNNTDTWGITAGTMIRAMLVGPLYAYGDLRAGVALGDTGDPSASVSFERGWHWTLGLGVGLSFGRRV